MLVQVQVERSSKQKNDTLSLVSRVHEWVAQASSHVRWGREALHTWIGEVKSASTAFTDISKPAGLPDAANLIIHEDKSWRCDLHPAWNRDFTAVTINARPYGGERQVILLHLGTNLSQYFFHQSSPS